MFFVMGKHCIYIVTYSVLYYFQVLYVLQVHQDSLATTAHISSVAEFPLTQPCLSLSILEACTKRFKLSPNDSHLDEITTGKYRGLCSSRLHKFLAFFLFGNFQVLV